MTRRIGERRNDFEHLGDGTWPSMRDDNRHRIRSAPTLVNEVNAEAIYFGDKLRKPVERRLLRRPVKLTSPVSHQSFQITQVRAIIPTRAFNLVRPTRARQPHP